MADNPLYTVKDRVGIITFNRPQVMNAMNSDTMFALRDLTLAIKDDPDVRAVLLRGNGNAFMAGGDVGEFHNKIADMPKLIVHFTREYHAAILNLRQMGKPVLACVHGVAAGAGLGLVAAAGKRRGAVVEGPHQHGAVVGDDALFDAEARRVHLAEHVGEDALDRRQAAHLVEGVLEVRVLRVERAEALDIGDAEVLVEGDQFIEVLHLRLR